MAAEQKRDPWSSERNDPWHSKGSGLWGGDGWGKKDDGWSKKDGGWSGRDSSRGGSQPLLWVGGAALALLLLGIFIIGPAYKGYAVYSALDGKIPDTYVTDMTKLQSDKTAAETAAQAAEAIARDQEREAAITQESLRACKEEYDACNADLVKARKLKDDLTNSLSNDVEQAKNDLAACQKELDGVEEKDAIIKEDEAVIVDAARRLCCIARIENSAINSFNVVDGKIVCASDGEKQISC